MTSTAESTTAHVHSESCSHGAAPAKNSNPKMTDIEERDGFVEYCRMRTCERLMVHRSDELEDAPMEEMQLIAMESKIEWRGFTDEMKMFWVDRGSVKTIISQWKTFLTDNNAVVPEVNLKAKGETKA